MNTNYSSWNTFLQKNIANYNEYNDQCDYTGNGQLDSISDNDIDKFNNDIIKDFENDLPNIKLLSPPIYHNDEQLVLYSYKLNIDKWDNNHISVKSDKKQFKYLTTHDKLDHIKFIKLTNSQLEKIHFVNVKCLDHLYLVWNDLLESINSTSIKNVNTIFLYSNSKFNNINIPSLEYANYISLSNLDSLCKIELNSLKSIKMLNISNNKCTTLNKLVLPSLDSCKNIRLYNNMFISSFHSSIKHVNKLVIENNQSLVDIDLSNLECAKTIIIKSNNNLKHIKLSELLKCSKLIIEDCMMLESVDNQSLECIYKFLHLDNCPKLEKFNYNIKHVKCAIINTKTDICKQSKCDTMYLSVYNKCFNIA